MYIKYLKNIHNIDNYYSVIRGKTGGQIPKDTSIHLIKHDANYLSLEFPNTESRDYILDEIWNKMEQGVEHYNIDKELEVYTDSKMYNVI
jgi:hypothetical protein